MAEKRIKDLIRKLTFDNTNQEHEYTEQMANIVFDDNDAAIEQAKEISGRLDDKIQKISKGLNRKSDEIKTMWQKKSEMTAEAFQKAIDKLNKHKQILSDLRETTKREKIDKGFPGLDKQIKKYAILRFLTQELIKISNFPTREGEDNFLYVDETEFFNTDIARNFREISDYINDVLERYESKIENERGIISILKNDAREFGIDIPGNAISAQTIVDIHNKINEKRAQEATKRQDMDEKIKQSQIGIEPVHDFGNGLVMYRLLPDTEWYNEHQEHRNLVYEGNEMGICIGQKGQPYSKDIFDVDRHQYYTLRSREKNGLLIPHCTIEVDGNIVYQVKGKANGPVIGKYIKQVRNFLRSNLDAILPGDEENDKENDKENEEEDKRQVYDIENIGFIDDVQGKSVDIFNLPPDTELRSIEFNLLQVRGVKTENIKFINVVNANETKLNDKDIELLKKIGRINQLMLNKVDLSKDLTFVGGSRGELDFAKIAPNAKEIDLTRTDLSKVTKLNFGPNVEKIYLTFVGEFRGELDFAKIAPNAKEINLTSADLSNVTRLNFGPKVEKITLRAATGLHGKLDFVKMAPNAKKIFLGVADLSNVTVIKVSNPDVISGVADRYKNLIQVIKPESKFTKFVRKITYRD